MNLIDIVPYSTLESTSPIKSTSDTNLRHTVSEIISRVSEHGDDSLIEYTKQFDNVQLQTVRVPQEEIIKAKSNIERDILNLLQEAIDNIRYFHEFQVSESWQKEFPDQTVLGEIVQPLDRVGIYVPGGKAFYPSTMIMNTVPAQIAGVPSIAITSPPALDGLPHPLVLGICAIMGIEEVYAVGGAQAIAALAFGTESIPSVCKITGPGNAFVQEAKRQVFGIVGIDSIAGPSEILILHDDEDIPVEFLVRDLLTQAEHDEDARATLITTSRQTADSVKKRIEKLVPTLPRSEIIKSSLKNNGKIIVVKTIEEGIELVNRIAPEHLEVLVTDKSQIQKVRNAGAIFVGKWATETVGDYFAGPNHTIPTNRAARFGSPLSVRDFQKHSSYIEYSRQRLLEQGETIAKFAELEGLFAHAAAIRERIK